MGLFKYKPRGFLPVTYGTSYVRVLLAYNAKCHNVTVDASIQLLIEFWWSISDMKWPYRLNNNKLLTIIICQINKYIINNNNNNCYYYYLVYDWPFFCMWSGHILAHSNLS